ALERQVPAAALNMKNLAARTVLLVPVFAATAPHPFTQTNGKLLIEGGRIVAVGKADEVEKPWDATVLGGPELVAFPGFVEAHTSQGMDRQNENIDVAPFLDIRDSIDPVAYFFEDCLRYGMTTVNV